MSSAEQRDVTAAVADTDTAEDSSSASAAIPARIPATANDLATSIMSHLGQHLELGCRLTFDSRLDADLLGRAVRLSLDAEPVLGCGLRTSFMTAWWQRLGDLDERAPFSVVDTDDAEADAREFQTEHIADEGPQVAVRLLRGREHDDLSFRISHNVADGQATKQYAYLLADLYTKLLADPAYVPAPQLAARPQVRDAWEQLSAEERRSAAREPRPTMPNWRLPCTGVTGHGRTTRELTLPPQRFSVVKAYGKSRGATVNEMLLTTFFRALTRVYPPPEGRPMSLAFSADHRRYLRDADAIPITNLAITIWLGVPYLEGEGFDGTLRRVVELISVWRDSLWSVKGALRTAGMTKMGYKPMAAVMGALMGGGNASAGTCKTSPIFTNIGVIDEGQLSFGGAVPSAASLTGPAAFGASFVPTISTYRDTLAVSMGFCAADTAPSAVEGVLDSMAEELSGLEA